LFPRLAEKYGDAVHYQVGLNRVMQIIHVIIHGGMQTTVQ
jgi:hypothetical protein